MSVEIKLSHTAAMILQTISAGTIYGFGIMELTGLRPNIDTALVALERTLHLPEGSALAIFAAGRTAGWIAHALEQQQDGRLIRPRAIYAGSATS